jgi:hypothetical protein
MYKALFLVLLIAVPALQQGTTTLGSSDDAGSVVASTPTQGSIDLPPIPASMAQEAKTLSVTTGSKGKPVAMLNAVSGSNNQDTLS